MNTFQQDPESSSADINIESLIDNLGDQDYSNTLDDYLQKEPSNLTNNLSNGNGSSNSGTSNIRSLEPNTLGSFGAATFDLHNIDISQLDLTRDINDFTRQTSSNSLDTGMDIRNATSFSTSAIEKSQSLSEWDRSMENVFKSDSYASSLNVAAKQFKPLGLASQSSSSVDISSSNIPVKPVSAISMSVQDYESAFLDYRAAQGIPNPAASIRPDSFAGAFREPSAVVQVGYPQQQPQQPPQYPQQHPPQSNLRPEREAFAPAGMNRAQYPGPTYRQPHPEAPAPYAPYEYDYDYRDEYEGEYGPGYGPPSARGGIRGHVGAPTQYGQPNRNMPGPPQQYRDPRNDPYGYGQPTQGPPMRGYPGPPLRGPARRAMPPPVQGRRDGYGGPGYDVRGFYPGPNQYPGPYRPEPPPPHMSPDFGPTPGYHGGFDPIEDELFSLTIGAVVKKDSLLGGCGWWISDSNKVITVHGSAPVQQIYPSHVRLEYESLLNGLKAAYLKHIRVLLVRSSSEIILTLLRHQNFPFFNSLYMYLNDITSAIEKLLPHFKQLDLELITKEQNYYAHKLAGDVVVSFTKRRENKLFPVPITPPTVPIPASALTKKPTTSSASSTVKSVGSDDSVYDPETKTIVPASGTGTGTGRVVPTGKSSLSAINDPVSMESIMARFGFPSNSR